MYMKLFQSLVFRNGPRPTHGVPCQFCEGLDKRDVMPSVIIKLKCLRFFGI